MSTERANSAELLEGIRALRAELGEQMSMRWQRDLPLGELLSDRWERARRLGFGEGASIYENTYVYGDVSVAEHTWIGPLVMLDGSGGIEIGHHCSISTGVQIYSHDTVRWALSGGEAEPEREAVRVGDCTYLGANATVLKGVTIGDHCVVGAGSVVTRDLPPCSVAVGVPARVAGKVTIDDRGRIELELDETSALERGR